MSSLNDIYIRNAFKELEAFSVPGIGTFRKVHEAARQEHASMVIYPPSVRIEFSPVVDYNIDITQHLVNNIHLEKEQAHTIVSELKHSIQSALTKDKYYTIGNVGRLYENDKGKLYFEQEQSEKSIFADEYFGFMPVNISNGANYSQKTYSSMTTDFDSTHSKAEKNVLYSTLRHASFVVIFLVFGGLLVYIASKPLQIRHKRASVVAGVVVPDTTQEDRSLAVLDTVSTRTTVTPATPLAENTITQEKTPTKEDPTSLTSSAIADASTSPKKDQKDPIADFSARKSTEEPEEEGVSRGLESPSSDLSVLGTPKTEKNISGASYHVISGSFSTFAAAEKDKQAYEKMGYKPLIIQNANKYRVSIFQHADKSKVDSFVERLKRQGMNNVWVFTQRN